MTRAADVPLPEPVFHVLRENAPSSLGLLPGMLPSAPFPCEAVDDSLGARHRIDSSRCSRQAVRRREDRECRQTPCYRGAVSGTFRTLLTRTRVAVCGYVRIPMLRPAVAQANGPSQNPLPAAGFPRLMPHRLHTFPAPFARARVGACGSVRISLPLAARGASQPSQNCLPATPSVQPMPDPFCTRLSRTRDAVCGSVRIQPGPHPSGKDTRP